MATKKVVLIGEFNSGKTCLVTRLIRNYYYATLPTIGASFTTWKPLNSDQKYSLGIWDTAGQERFSSIVPLYLRDAKVVIYCHPINKPWLDKHVLYYYTMAKEASKICKFIIAITMCDIKELILVNQSQIDQFATSINIDLTVWTSALTGNGVYNLFENIYYNFTNDIIETNNNDNDNNITFTRKTWKKKASSFFCLGYFN